ncbi:MAG: glycosyltransferase [Chloroflexi bacterium]|nr:glycosyltransferase [Chloroflexota bacterium]
MKPLTPSDGSPLLSLPFDHYERYALTRTLVEAIKRRRRRPQLNVLDVGGAPASLPKFLPQDNILTADLEAMDCEDYIRADGTALPFRDGAFDVVTCHDTLEHVTADHREAFLQELMRVADDVVIIIGPFFALAVEAAERLVAQITRDSVGKGHPTLGYLGEHAELGLPRLDETLKIVDRAGFLHTVLPNGPLDEWFMKMAVKHHLSALSSHGLRPHEFDRLSNEAHIPSISAEPTYRQAVIISKGNDARLLQHLREKLPQTSPGPAQGDDIEVSASFVSSTLAHYLSLLREGLQTKDHHIANIDGVVGKLRAAITRFDAELTTKDTLLTEKDALVLEKDTLLTEKDALLTKKDTLLTKKDTLLGQTQASLADKDQHITNIEAALAQMQTVLDETEEQLREVRQQFQVTTSTLGYRLLSRARAIVNRLAPPETRRRGALKLPTKGLRIILTEGWGTFLRRAVRVWRWGPRMIRPARVAAQAGSLDEQYQLWLRKHALTPARIRRIRKEVAQFSYRPKISIIMPVYNPDPAWLRDAIESVRAQLYDNWEFCIADDASSKPEVKTLLQEYQGDKRIKIAYLKKNHGISGASNAALAMATGEYVGFLDHDDELKPDALYEMVKLLNDQPDLDFIYSDEDKRSLEGRLVQPFFKPDWSPDLLLSTNYVPHFAVYRKRIVDDVGGLRSKCDFSQDYDLVLRVTERTNRIGHVALPLYAWRMVPGSAASDLEAKPKSIDAAKRALADAMKRRGIKADILEGNAKTTYRVRYRIQGQPLVSIVIPTRDRVDLLSQCIASIEKKTSYPNYEIVIVDNDSTDERTIDYLKKSRHRCLAFPGAFHFASMMNFAIRATAGEHVILLNNDTEIITDEWIEAMLEHSQRPVVAAVGARLFYPDHRVQHEGVIMGLGGGSAGNVDHGGYFGLGELVRNCSAVTAACMMARRDIFQRLGGFDEKLGIAFNDVDYCLRAREQGYLIVYTPYAVLYHHESATRKGLHPDEDEQYFRDRWGNPGEYQDPYYNPNLDLVRPFAIRL